MKQTMTPVKRTVGFPKHKCKRLQTNTYAPRGIAMNLKPVGEKQVDIVGPCQRPLLDTRMKERAEYTPEGCHGQERSLQGQFQLFYFFASLRLCVKTSVADF
jgi:hypothetical protein